jgi:hypothetical protein
MELIITIQNESDQYDVFDIIHANRNYLTENSGLPSFIKLNVKTVDKSRNISEYISYSEFLANLLNAPIKVYAECINSKQIEFYTNTATRKNIPIIPQLDLNRNRRCPEGYFTYEPCDWNIADTAEHFALDAGTFIRVRINPKQEMEIALHVVPTMSARDVTNLIEQSVK